MVSQLLRGATRGWGEVLNGAGPLWGVAKWKGEVWVAAEERGILKVAGSTLVPGDVYAVEVNRRWAWAAYGIRHRCSDRREPVSTVIRDFRLSDLAR